MSYRLAIFDFDGTLADSFPFLARVFNQLAERHGFAAIPPAEIDAYRQYSAREMMQRVGLPSWKLPLVARDFLALMKQEAAGIPLFAGIDAALHQLAASGVTLAIVSSNSEDNIRSILGPAIAGQISQFECGMSIFGKATRIRKVLTRAGRSSREAIYIGDQVTDLEAAREASVAFGAVAWGYATHESLRAHRPDEEFAEVHELTRIA